MKTRRSSRSTLTKPKKTLTLGCMTWHGETVKAVEAARDEELTRLFVAGEDIPTFVDGGDGKYAGLVFQRHNGSFDFCVIENGVRRPVHSSANPWSRAFAERQLRNHLAQLMTTPRFLDGKLVVGPTCDGLSVIQHEEDRQSHLRWVAWQQSYAELRVAGASEYDAHRLAAADAAEHAVALERVRAAAATKVAV